MEYPRFHFKLFILLTLNAFILYINAFGDEWKCRFNLNSIECDITAKNFYRHVSFPVEEV